MNHDGQSWAALAVVTLTVAAFVWRWVRKARKGKGGPGCGTCGHK